MISNRGTDNISLYDLCMQEVGWDTTSAPQQDTLRLVLLVLLACVEEGIINTDKLARLATRVTGGALQCDTAGTPRADTCSP